MEQQQETLNFNDIIKFFRRWFKQLAIIGLIAIIAAAIFSSTVFITPKYKSTVIFYPSTNNSISNALLTELTQRQKDPLEFGEEEEAEKALQILQSDKLTQRLVRNFNLMKHYKIDPSGKYPQTQLQDKIDENIGYSRTRYLSIKIDVLDEDPAMAAKLANGIAALYDTIKTEIQKEVSIPALAIVEKAKNDKEQELGNLHQQMYKLGQEGLTNYDEQTRALSEEIYKAQSKGDMKRASELVEEQKRLVQNGGIFLSLQEKIQLEEDKLSDLKARYEKAKIDVEQSLSSKFIVSAAGIAEKKSYPIRWLIVAVTFFTSIGLASIALAMYDNLKKKRTPQT